MSTDRDILTLAQWLSPAFPVGAFAYSHGLEAAIQSDAITSGQDLKDWLTDIIIHGSGRNDCILLRAAHACADNASLDIVNDTALAFAASAERQLEQTLQGAAFCKTTAAIWGGTGHGYVYPVAVGQAAARQNIDVSLTAAMYLQAISSNLISAAMRLMALGQTEGQNILASLTILCDETAKATTGTKLDDLQSTAFMVDIAAMHHETLQPRIFRT
ncbi:urease accessory protein UreF [Roseobacter sp. CCS2]|uniref:urease accessory protein UreF n=1 Tax=Roseobacter sp. CCS2 TaxID=391593 RepID=UPI0000F3E02B|nr:urease accessory UreF family protein [Roseobacter sp. CCS2]EBA12146.1 urease accessory protein UreF [Roseobacter sp. CCS2]